MLLIRLAGIIKLLYFGGVWSKKLFQNHSMQFEKSVWFLTGFSFKHSGVPTAAESSSLRGFASSLLHAGATDEIV